MPNQVPEALTKRLAELDAATGWIDARVAQLRAETDRAIAKFEENREPLLIERDALQFAIAQYESCPREASGPGFVPAGKFVLEHHFDLATPPEEPAPDPEVRVSDRILAELANGPITASLLAAKMGKTTRFVGAYLGRLKKSRQISIWSGRGSTKDPYVWALPVYAEPVQ